MLADGINLSDRRSGMNQRAIGRDQIVKGDLIVNRLFDNRRSSAAEHEYDERGRSLRLQRRADGARRADGFGVWRRMSAAKIAENAHLRRGLNRTRHNAFHRRLADLLRESLDHRVSSLADGNHQDARIRIEMVKIFADAQHTTLTMDVFRKCLGNRGLSQRVAKDLASNVAHFAKLRFGISVRGHRMDYKERLSAGQLSARRVGSADG